MQRDTGAPPHADPQITPCGPADFDRMLSVWERSVRASHDFLTAEQITALRPHVPEAFASAGSIHGTRDPRGCVTAFVGVTDNKIDMLFVDPDQQGKGYGRALFVFSRRVLGATLVDVNEDNHAAIAFYEKLGAKRVGRSEFDDFGNPYPLLHLSF